MSAATNDWLADRQLSESAISSYRGEVKRFAEHLVSVGVQRLDQLSERHWSDYLVSLVSLRTGVASRRKSALRQASALQAARITRSFLRHCWSRGWLTWLPGIENKRCLAPKDSRAQPSDPRVLGPIVLDTEAQDDERSARSRCAISLAFWGGLKPRELARLRRCDLVVHGLGSGGSLRVSGRTAEVVCPPELVAQIERYDSIRRKSFVRLDGEAPLLSHLRSAQALSPHTAWTLLRRWPADAQHTEQSHSRLSSKAIRDGYMALARSDAMLTLSSVAQQTGHAVGAAIDGRQDVGVVCIDQVRTQLLEV